MMRWNSPTYTAHRLRSSYDFGSVEVGPDRLFWKIDYYDAALANHSPDPSDASVTTRVLTIMLAEEY